MTIRLRIERVVVDRDLAGPIDPRAFGDALQAELARLLSGAPPVIGAPVPGGERSPRLPPGPRGSLAERLAGSLHQGVPALRDASRRGGRQ